MHPSAEKGELQVPSPKQRSQQSLGNAGRNESRGLHFSKLLLVKIMSESKVFGIIKPVRSGSVI